MNPKDIKNNEDLREYISWLAQVLRTRGQEAMSDRLNRANDFACGSPSEFLHEGGCALREVTASSRGKLSDAEEQDIAAVIRLIDEAFKKVGGA